MLFRPRHFYSTPSNPVPCPALLRDKPCTLPRCLFSHDLKLPPPPPAPPPSKHTAAAQLEEDEDPYEPPPAEAYDDSYEPSPAVVPENTQDLRLKAIVEAANRRDVDVREKRPRSSDQLEERKVVIDVDSAGDTPAATKHTSKDSALASPDAWPTPAQASKKVKISKKDEVPPDTFYGSPVCFIVLTLL
jgi:hypothetical protein